MNRALRHTVLVLSAVLIIVGAALVLLFIFSQGSQPPPNSPQSHEIPPPPSSPPPTLPHSPNRPATAPAEEAEQRRAASRERNSPGGDAAFAALIKQYAQPHSGTITLRVTSHEGGALVRLRSPALPQTEPGDFGIKEFALPSGYTWEENIDTTTLGHTVWHIDVEPLEYGLHDSFSCAILLEGHLDDPYTTSQGPSAHCTVAGYSPDESANGTAEEAQP